MTSEDRSFLEKLSRLIPGYAAYQDQESRREDDRRTRAFLKSRLGDVKARLDEVAKQAVASGDLETPAALEPLRTRLELAQNRLAAAVEGYASWFGDRQVDASLLGEIAQLDANLVSLVDQLDDLSKQLSESPADRSELSQAADLLHARIDRRSELLQRGS